MYTVTRKNRIKEQLQLCHADGTVALTADVDLNVDAIAGRVSKAYEALAMAQNTLQNSPNDPNAAEAYGRAVLAVFEVIFGEENARNIVAFYENNWTEMLLDLFPFINNEIMPQIRAASEERKAQLLEAARAAGQDNRKHRGLFK
jgi:hypothetical protein